MSTLSVVDIYNLALSHLGIGKEVGSLTEKTEEARACNRYFSITKDAMLRYFPWPFSTKIDALALIEEDPNDEWAYSYQIPSDCLNIKRILSGSRNDSRQERVSYKLTKGASGTVIFTDMEDAQAEYTVLTDDSTLYPVDFGLALSFRLAAYVAPRLTNGDPFKMGDRAMQMYEYELRKAQATVANEEQPDQLPDSEFIRGRE